MSNISASLDDGNSSGSSELALGGGSQPNGGAGGLYVELGGTAGKA